jgi:uroporphyrinogen-III synthase
MGKKVKSILISQPYPTDENSPYLKLAEKWGLKLDFRKFIEIEGVTLNEFRKQISTPWTSRR